MALTTKRAGLAPGFKRLTSMKSLSIAISTAWKPVLPTPTFDAILTQSRFQSNKAKIQELSANEGQKLLADLRMHRPVSPHLGIYKWNMGSIMSSMMRITGVAYSSSFYLFGLAYLVSHYLGWDLSSANIAAAFASMPKPQSRLSSLLSLGLSSCTPSMRTGWAAICATTLGAGYMVFLMS
ncbi:hypothetical protein KCU95_g13114, partial [Aureobasidium melanogenum]